MKKLKYTGILGILILGLGILHGIPSHANVLVKSTQHTPTNQKEWNVICGNELTYNGERDLADHIDYFIGKYVGNGTVTTYMRGTVFDEECELKEELTFTDECLTYYCYYFNDELFYEAEVDFQDTYIYTDEEIDLPILYDNPDAVFVRSGYYHEYPSDMEYDSRDLDDDMDGYMFSMTYCEKYTFTEESEESDIYILGDIDNPLTMDEVMESVEAKDNCGSLTTWYDHNSYNPATAEPGVNYAFRFLAQDDSHNITVQWFYVRLEDIKKPVITQNDEIVTEYGKELSEDDLKKHFTLEDNITKEENLIVSFDITDYKDHLDTLGTYTCSISVTDEAENTRTEEFTITIQDTTGPEIITFSMYYTDTENKIDLNTIKDDTAAIDAYYGDVSESLDYTDKNDYENNWNVPGIYTYIITAEDSLGNSSELYIGIYVTDITPPTIGGGKYAIYTEKGGTITKEEIIKLFESLGYDLDAEEIEGEVFEETELDGEYDLFITHGDIPEVNTITTEVPDDIDYSTPEVKEKKKNTTLIIILSISGVLITGGAIGGAMIYRKRH